MTRTVKDCLLSAYRSSQLELAEFGTIGPADIPLPTTEKEVTPFIRARTELYRKSWLILPLSEALDALGFKSEREQIDLDLAQDPRTWSAKASKE